MNDNHPTPRTYNCLENAYHFYDRKLFCKSLPPCLITLNRKTGFGGYHHGNRFKTHNGGEVFDEIALNPTHFHEHPIEYTLSILVHEMTHLQQKLLGTDITPGYHNQAWGELMEAVGLMPSANCQKGGKKVGYRMGHYIIQGGAFERATSTFLSSRLFKPLLVENQPDDKEKEKSRKKLASKTKYTCGKCGNNTWARPHQPMTCTPCRRPFKAAA